MAEWILKYGIWNDDGIWDDSDVWRDGPPSFLKVSSISIDEFVSTVLSAEEYISQTMEVDEFVDMELTTTEYIMIQDLIAEDSV